MSLIKAWNVLGIFFLFENVDLPKCLKNPNGPKTGSTVQNESALEESTFIFNLRPPLALLR